MNRVYTDIFHGVAKMPDGRIEETDGTLMQCSAWAEQLIREGSKEIEIRTTPDKGELKHE